MEAWNYPKRIYVSVSSLGGSEILKLQKLKIFKYAMKSNIDSFAQDW